MALTDKFPNGKIKLEVILDLLSIYPFVKDGDTYSMFPADEYLISKDITGTEETSVKKLLQDLTLDEREQLLKLLRQAGILADNQYISNTIFSGTSGYLFNPLISTRVGECKYSITEPVFFKGLPEQRIELWNQILNFIGGVAQYDLPLQETDLQQFANKEKRSFFQISQAEINTLAKNAKIPKAEIEEKIKEATEFKEIQPVEIVKQKDINKYEYGFLINPPSAYDIDNTDDKTQIAEYFKRVSDLLNRGKDIKYYLALHDICSEYGTSYLNNLPLTEFIKRATGKSSEQMRQRDRIEATKCLLYFNNYQIRIPLKKTSKPLKKKDKRGKSLFEVTVDYAFIRLFELDRATLRAVIAEDGKVIQNATFKTISGRFKFPTNTIGHYYPKAIFKLSINEEERIKLALQMFISANRKSQQDVIKKSEINFSDYPIQWQRITWIEKAGLKETNETKKAIANQQLKNTFEKLKEVGIIKKHYPENIPNNDNSIITVWLADIEN